MKAISKDRRVFWGNTVWQYVLQAAKYCFPLITLPYLTRVLGPDTYAVRVYVVSAMTIAQVVLDYGFTTYGTRIVALNRTKKERVGALCYVIVTLRIGLSLLTYLSILAISGFIPMLADNFVYVLIAFIGTCFKAMLPDFVFRGYEDMGVITKRYLVSQLVSVVLILGFVKTPADLLLVPIFEGLANLIAFAWSWWDVLAKREIRLSRPSRLMYLTAVKESTEFFLSNAATQVISGATTLVIGYLVLDKAEISYWSIAVTAIGAVQSLYAPISNSLYPHVVVRKDYSLVKLALKAGIPVVLVGTVAFAATSDFIMLVLGGEEYMAGAYLLRMLSPILLASYPAIILGTPVLGASGHMRLMMMTSIAAAVFHAVGLAAITFLGLFQIGHVAVLRCFTEIVLLAGRAFCAVPVLKNGGRDDETVAR